MLLTEEQAREKWCAHARAETTWHSPAGDVFLTACGNAFMKDGEEVRTLCIASECMAWRWALPERRKMWHSQSDVPPPGPDWRADSDVYETTKELPQHIRTAGEKQFARDFVRTAGYCGLAGKPA